MSWQIREITRMLCKMLEIANFRREGEIGSYSEQTITGSSSSPLYWLLINGDYCYYWPYPWKPMLLQSLFVFMVQRIRICCLTSPLEPKFERGKALCGSYWCFLITLSLFHRLCSLWLKYSLVVWNLTSTLLIPSLLKGDADYFYYIS